MDVCKAVVGYVYISIEVVALYKFTIIITITVEEYLNCGCAHGWLLATSIWHVNGYKPYISMAIHGLVCTWVTQDCCCDRIDA